jgi:hypothetical protein
MRERKIDLPDGRIVETYRIGPYVIVEYHPHKLQGSNYLREIDESRTEFYGYEDGKKARESWNSLEEAMVGLIVKHFVGLNYHAINRHFMAGLKAMAEDAA